MSTPHFPTLTNSVPFPFYPLAQDEGFNIIQDNFDSGHIGTRARYTHPRRRWTWNCPVLLEADVHAIMGFLYARNGGYFYVDVLCDVWDPYDAPTSSETTYGALAERTYYTRYTWSDATYETRPSQEDTQLVAVNKVLTLTVPTFPKSVTQANLYIGTSAGTGKLVSKLATTGATWTEPTTTVNDTSAASQPVLKVAATTYSQAGDYVIIGSGTGREEKKRVLTVQAGVSLTMTTNLTYEHTLAQADVVQIDCTSGASVPTDNTMDEEVKVVLANNPVPTRMDAKHWGLSLELVEMF